MWRLCAVAFLVFAPALSAAQPANLSGTWVLKVDQSAWGSRPKPISVILQVQHEEPVLTYSGSVMYAGEDTRSFRFDGVIDGLEYRMDRSFGAGKVTLRRIDASTFESVFRTDDGLSVETTQTTVSSNGRAMTRRIRLRSAGVTSTSTEVYERR